MSEGKFDAALIILRGIVDHPGTDRLTIYEDFKADKLDEFKAAISVLEAAGKMNPEWWLMMAGQLSGINFSNQHPEVALVWLKQTFRALLESLPDEEPTVAASRKVKEEGR
jgi:hypothetical protein